MTSRTSATSSGSSALVTSSSSMMSGCMASARTIATRCCWPPESRSGYSSALSARPKRSSSSRASASAASRSDAAAPRDGRQRDVAQHRHVREEVERLEHDADPPPDGVEVGVGPVISSASSRIRPASIGSSRLMHRSSVDLPEPEAPIRQITSCGATARSMPAQHLEVAERLAHALEPDRRARSSGTSSRLPPPALARDQAVGEPRQRDRDQDEQEGGHQRGSSS